jgi:pimeloyl-ACP methyl ester carboxylesterase
MPFAANKGVHIHYETEGQGPPLVLQHWSLATLESWYDYGYVSALQGDWRLILLDARGHGASDKPHSPEAYELEKLVGDIVAVLDDLGVGRADFFGYSMGGWIGFGVARYAPERFRSLVIGGQHPYAQDMEEMRQLARLGIEKGPEAVVALLGGEPRTLSSETRERMYERMLAYDYEAFLSAFQDRESLAAVLPTISMPCLLYAGDRDEAYPLVNQCAEQMANATFVTLPGLDHMDALMRSDEVLPHVKRFLEAASQPTRTA